MASVNVDALVTAHASACRMGADASVSGSTVMVPATRTSIYRTNGGTTAAQCTTASIVDATIAARSFAAPRVNGAT